MDLKPSDFFIGVIDFFSVILPGALVTYFLKGLFYSDVFGVGKVFPPLESEVQKWIAFLLITYVIGNFLFLLGSILLDKFVYDKLRNPLFKKNFDLSYLTATAIRDRYIAREVWISDLVAAKAFEFQSLLSSKETQRDRPWNAAGHLRLWFRTFRQRRRENDLKKFFRKDRREIINTFKWAQHYLAVKYPETLTDIHKFEADSKFFRSLVIAFAFIGSILLWKHERGTAVLFFVLSLLSLYRYGELRYKATERAYELILTLDNLIKSSEYEPGVLRQDNRVLFSAPPETLTLHQNTIAAFTKGSVGPSEVLAIPGNQTWKVVNSSYSETLFCLAGRCIAKTKTGTGQEQTVVLSSNAVVPLPRESSFSLTNQAEQSLLLLLLRST